MNNLARINVTLQKHERLLSQRRQLVYTGKEFFNSIERVCLIRKEVLATVDYGFMQYVPQKIEC